MQQVWSGWCEGEGSLGEGSGPDDARPDEAEEARYPRLVPRSRPAKCRPYSLLDQLHSLYHEELRNSPDPTTSHLLAKLVQRDKYNMVVVTLHPVGEGYSVGFQLDSGKLLEEEARYPYTQDSLLQYIDCEQLPTPFLEYWEHSVPKLFYDGCVVCRIKDLRHGHPPNVSHVLLRPHTQSLVGDVHSLLTETDELWTPEESFSIESNIINNANRTLCLDPNPEVGRRLLKMHQDRHAVDTISVRKLLYRASPLLQHRKRKYENVLPRSNHFLANFLEGKRARTEADRGTSPARHPRPPVLEPQMKLDRWITPREVCRCARCRGGGSRCGTCRSGELCRCEHHDSDDFSPRVITEWVLENRVENTTRHVRLTILQRPVNYEYLAQIYMDNCYVEGKSDGSTCRFTLGSRDNAHSFVKQYIELYTAEGTQKVNITQLGPGHIVK